MHFFCWFDFDFFFFFAFCFVVNCAKLQAIAAREYLEGFVTSVGFSHLDVWVGLASWAGGAAKAQPGSGIVPDFFESGAAMFETLCSIVELQ